MIGKIIVLEPPDYQRWLSGGTANVSMEEVGQKLFQRLGCSTCHLPSGVGLGPSLVGLFGSPVHLQGGQTIRADENYIRESILEPRAKIVAGYAPVMPPFKGQISEDGILQIIAYIKSLKREERTQTLR
jgi:cytochrome c oxidase subunit 2